VGDAFAVDEGDTIAVYSHDAGPVATFLRRFPKDATAAGLAFTQSGAGATPRTVQAKLRDTVSVKDFGAVGDGVTNDTAAIQAAIDAVSAAGGGMIIFPLGEYINSGVVILTDNVTLRGEGNATLIKYTGDGTAQVAAFCFGQALNGSGTITPVDNCAIRDMQIDGNRAGGAIGSAVRTTAFNRFTLENVHTYDCKNSYGFAIIGTGQSPRNDLLVRNCSAFRCGADGLDIKAGLNRIVIDGFVTGDHLDETGADSVGIDVRGSYASVHNVFALNCIEIGIRIRINIGQIVAANWNVTEDAQVSVSNCYAIGCRDGYALEAPLNSTITASNIHAIASTRFGIAMGGDTGEGHVFVNGGSAIDCLVGVQCSSLKSGSISDFAFVNTGQDVITFRSGFTGRMLFNNVEAVGTVRYQVFVGNLAAGSRAQFVSCKFNGGTYGFLGTGGTFAGNISLLETEVTGASTRGFQVDGTGIVNVTRGRISGNTVNVFSVPTGSRFFDVEGYKTRAAGAVSFDVASTGVKSINFTHGLGLTPDIDDVQIALRRDTNVNDYDVSWIRLVATSSTIVSAQCNVVTASATGGATALVNFLVDASVPA
jgi:hypothetical protein